MEAHRYLIVDFFPKSYTSEFLHFAKSLKFMDVLKRPDAIMATMWHVVATGTNRTLISVSHPHYINKTSYPHMIPSLTTSHAPPRTIRHVWNTHYGNSSETPAFILTPSQEWNFVYCSTPMRKQDSIWGFDILTDPFDYTVWIYLTIALFLTSALTCQNICSAKKCLSTIFSNFAYIVGQTTIPVAGSVRKYSPLFALWALFCSLLINLYSGEITSAVIRPAPEVTIPTIAELENKSYTLLYENPVWVISINKTGRNDEYISPDKLIFARMISNGVKIIRDKMEYFREMSRGETKVASVMHWVYTIWAVVGIMESVISVNPNPDRRRTKCYVGSQLIASEYTVFGFIPPQHVKVSQVFQKSLLETGLYNYMIREMFAREYISRVQDRGKIISKTKILNEQTDEEKVVVLTLHGKIRIIFLLWIILITASLVAFGIEMGGDCVSCKEIGCLKYKYGYTGKPA